MPVWKTGLQAWRVKFWIDSDLVLFGRIRWRDLGRDCEELFVASAGSFLLAPFEFEDSLFKGGGHWCPVKYFAAAHKSLSINWIADILAKNDLN